MLSGPPLNERQMQQYREEGYVLLGQVMDGATLEVLRREEERLRQFKQREFGTQDLTFFASQVTNHSEPVRRYACGGPHLDRVRQLVGPNLALWFTQFVTKHPDANSGKSVFPWHQDNGYAQVDPPTNATVWVALDDVNEENGCVWVMPGSHKKGLLPHAQRSAESWHLEVPVEGDGVPAVLKAGEAVAFSGLTLHRSKLNQTSRLRRAFFMEYAEPTARVGAERSLVFRSPDAFVVAGAVPLEKAFVTWM